MLRQQCRENPDNNNRETIKEQNNYKMWIQKISEQIDTKADKWNIQDRNNSRKL